MRRVIWTILLLCVAVSLAVAVPRPKQSPGPIVGVWEIQWGSSHQVTTFHEDGTCESPQNGKGTWRFTDGSIYFGERGDRAQYVMSFDENGFGKGAYIDSDGTIGFAVDVTARRNIQ